MLVRFKKVINNLLKFHTTQPFANIIRENYQSIIQNLDTSKNFQKRPIYQCVYDYLIQYDYLLIEKELIDFINSYQEKKNYHFQYQEINQIKKVSRQLLTKQLMLLVNEQYLCLMEETKIRNAIKKLKQNRDISLNRYYLVTENTSNQSIFLLNQEIEKLNNEKVFRTFDLTLQSHGKELSPILAEVKKTEILKIYLLNNIIHSFQEISDFKLHHFYQKNIDLEKLLNKDHIYSLMTEESKQYYRKKILKKRRPFVYLENHLKEKKHIGFFLFQHSHYLFSLDYKNRDIPNTSKTMINLSQFFSNKEQIDLFFKELEKNIAPNIYFNIINENLTLEEELVNYLEKKCRILNKSQEVVQVYQKNQKIVYSKNIKYVLSLYAVSKIEIDKIKYLLGIMDHPLNLSIMDRKRKKLNGTALLLLQVFNENECSLFNRLYQKEQMLLGQNEFYRLKEYTTLNRTFLHDQCLKRKFLKAKYIKNIIFHSNHSPTFNHYLKNYQKFLKKNIYNLKNSSWQQKILILSQFKKEFIYFFFLLTIIIFPSWFLFSVQFICLLVWHHSNHFLSSFLKAFNEYTNIPTYLSLLITKRYYSKQYFFNIGIGILLLLQNNLVGFIFILSLPLLFFMNKVKESKNEKIDQLAKENLSKKQNYAIPNMAILSNQNISLYIDKEENSTCIYHHFKVSTINYKKDISLIDLDLCKELEVIDSTISFDNNRVKITKTYQDIQAIIEPVISPLHDVEIKKITLQNNSKKRKKILCKIYFPYEIDEKLLDDSCLTIKKEKHNLYVTAYFLGGNSDYSILNTLTNTQKIAAYQQKEIYFITTFSKKLEKKEVLHLYHSPFKFSSFYALIKKEENSIHHLLLSYLWQINKFKLNEAREKLLTYNYLSTKELQKFGITENIPIILLDLKNSSQKTLIKEIILFFKYCKLNHFIVHLIILNGVDQQYIEELVYHINQENSSLTKIPGSIYQINEQELTPDEIILFYTLSYLTIDASNYSSLKNYVQMMSDKISIAEHSPIKIKKSLPISFVEEMNNFKDQTNIYDAKNKEYLIFNQTNENVFSHIFTSPTSLKTVTNLRAKSYTYLDSQIKLSSREEILVNHSKISFAVVKYGLGYTSYLAKTKKLEITMTEFISYFEKIKFYQLKIKNISNDDLKLSLQYIIHPILSENILNSERYILCKYDYKKNLITLQNKLNSYFLENTCFITCTEKIAKVQLHDPVQKTIEIKKNIFKDSSCEFAFTLGITNSSHLDYLKEKYSTISTINTALAISINYFKTILNTVTVQTNDEKFNQMMNHFLLYKTVTEKVFQQDDFVSLKHCCTIINILPNVVKDVIINCAKKPLKGEEIFDLIHAVYVYIIKTEQKEILTELINEHIILYYILEKNLQRFIDEEHNSYHVYEAIKFFIEIIKIYDKKIDTTSYLQKLTIFKRKIEDKVPTNLIDETYKILIDAKHEDEKIYCSKYMPKDFFKQEFLFLQLLLKQKSYDLLYYHCQNMSLPNQQNRNLLNQYAGNFYQMGLEEILGFQKKGIKLYISPHLPSSIKDYQITYRYLNTLYHINIILQHKENKIMIDNYKITTDYIELKNDHKTHEVHIYKKRK